MLTFFKFRCLLSEIRQWRSGKLLWTYSGVSADLESLGISLEVRENIRYHVLLHIVIDVQS